jgi:hypothetical protein
MGKLQPPGQARYSIVATTVREILLGEVNACRVATGSRHGVTEAECGRLGKTHGDAAIPVRWQEKY